MTDHEMLEELIAFKRQIQRKQNAERILYASVILILVIVLAVAGIRVNNRMKQLQKNMERVYTATEEIESFFDGLKTAGYENMADALRDLKEATGKINGFFDGLGEKGMQNIEEGMGLLNDGVDWVRGFLGSESAG